MPSQSKSQQHLMGMVHAVQTGKMKSPSKKISKLAKSMTKKSAKEFASTKTKGLPTKKKVVKENYDNAIGTIHTVLKPYPGCTPDSMVKQIDPVMGAQHHGIDHQTIHGVYPTQDEAKKVAEDIHKQYEGDMKKLEEKKDSVAKKLTTTIDKLEKKRKDHMKLAKENPDHASEHKQHISQIQSQIEDLMDKLEKVSKSKKEDENEEDELDNIAEEFKTKDGYLKDGFVVDDNSVNGSSYETDDDDEDEDVTEDTTNDLDDVIDGDMEDIGSELSEDEYSTF